MIHETLPMIEFTVEDRCDRCGARAIMLASHDDFGELMFCGHHRKEYKDILLDEGWTITEDYEEIERLNPDYYKVPV
jgi:ribosomal protein S27AE